MTSTARNIEARQNSFSSSSSSAVSRQNLGDVGSGVRGSSIYELSSAGPFSGSSSVVASRRKRTVVANACEACRRRKCKCDGKRPVCSMCAHKQVACVFDSEEGLRPVQLWKVRHQKATQQAADYKELIDALRNASTDETVTLLRRLRDPDDPIVFDGREDGSTHPSSPTLSAVVDATQQIKPGDPRSSRHVLPPYESARHYKTHQQAVEELRRARRQSDIHPGLQLYPRPARGAHHAAAAAAAAAATQSMHDVSAGASVPDSAYLLQNRVRFEEICGNGYPEYVQNQQYAQLYIPVHLMKPIELEDQCLLSSVYADFRRAAMAMLASGTPAVEIIGSDFVSVDHFFRERLPSDAHTTSSWACEVCKSFVELDVFVRLAIVSFLSAYMRWILVPNLVNYARLPEPIRPTPLQRCVPHIPAIQIAPHPAIRDAVIYSFRDWITPLNCTTNWPHTMAEAVEVDPGTGSLKLTDLFTNHVGDLNNWSYARSYLDTFPELEGLIRISG